jgi:hypothetical protein
MALSMVTLCAASERDFRSAAKNPSQHRKHGSLTRCWARIGETAPPAPVQRNRSRGLPLVALHPSAQRLALRRGRALAAGVGIFNGCSAWLKKRSTQRGAADSRALTAPVGSENAQRSQLFGEDDARW